MLYKLKLLHNVKSDLTIKEVLVIKKLYGNLKKFEDILREYQTQLDYSDELRKEIEYWNHQFMQLKMAPKETRQTIYDSGKGKISDLLNKIEKIKLLKYQIENIRKDILTLTNQNEIKKEMLIKELNESKLGRKDKLRRTLIGTLTWLICYGEQEIEHCLELINKIKINPQSN